MLVEVNCETDFVAKNEGFRAFVKDITLHIAAAQPHLRQPRGSARRDGGSREGDLCRAGERQAGERGREDRRGKLDKFYSTVCLLEQGFIKNPDLTIKELIASKIAEIGENIVIRRFTRYSVGEPLGNELTPAADSTE